MCSFIMQCLSSVFGSTLYLAIVSAMFDIQSLGLSFWQYILCYTTVAAMFEIQFLRLSFSYYMTSLVASVAMFRFQFLKLFYVPF